MVIDLADLNGAAEQVWLACQDRWPQLSIEVLPEVDSTNNRGLQLGRDGATAPVAVVAWQQTAGRGRVGRTWQAQPGHTLTLSLGLPMALAQVPGGGSALSLVVGLSVAESLGTLLPPAARPIGLKWPNDLWVTDRKLGGILIEAIQAPALDPEQRWVVIGIGINLQGTDSALASQRTDLAEWGAAVTPGQAMVAIVPPLLAACQAFEQHGFEAFAPAYAQRDVLAGRPVSLWRHVAPVGPSPLADAPPADVSGIALGVSPTGALQIRDAQGTTVDWHIGEVSVRPGQQGPALTV